MSKWEAWLPSPCEWRPMRGGLGGNKDFEGAEIEARSADSQWVSLLVEGTIGRNNALRLADASCKRTKLKQTVGSNSIEGRGS